MTKKRHRKSIMSHTPQTKHHVIIALILSEEKLYRIYPQKRKAENLFHFHFQINHEKQI